MAKKIKITAGGVQAEAELNESRTANAIWEALPLKGEANLWGEEIYFPIPVRLELENGQEVVRLGDLGYWPPGGAFCIFFGRTPVSRENEIRPASTVTVFGRITADATAFRRVGQGESVVVERE
ncbi:MAG: cyclophilin-like fold protein [Chloroflexota bacterium]